MARPRVTNASPKSPDPSAWLAFLLSQVGAHAADRFADRLAPLGLKPPHAGILRAIDRADGVSQQALVETLGVSRAAWSCCSTSCNDAGWSSAGTGRATGAYALHLTDAGREALKQIVRVAGEHQDDLCAALDATEREQLAGYLRRIAEQQRLAPGIHPGWQLKGEGRAGKS